MNPKTKWRYADVCRGIVADFDALPIDETLHKPRVGIVGEILVKYMPLANNHLVELLRPRGRGRRARPAGLLQLQHLRA